jgi:hypothetical protein
VTAADENNLAELLTAALSQPATDTMPERKTRERRVQLKHGHDGRVGRARQAEACKELNVKVPPETKAQVAWEGWTTQRMPHGN